MRPRFPKEGSDEEKLQWRLMFDFMWTCASLFKITEKEGNKLVDFRFNRGQMFVWWVMLNQMRYSSPVRLWILKGRQFGITTFFTAYLYWRAAFHGHNCLLLPHKEKPGRSMFRKGERIHRHLRKLTLPNGGKFVLNPDSWLKGTEMVWDNDEFQGHFSMEPADGDEPGVSGTFQHIHATEVPVWDDPDEVFGRLFPTLPETADTTFVGEFTAREEGDYTHSLWLEAERGDSWLTGVFLPWYWKEEYTRPRRESDADFSGEEVKYRRMVAEMGFEYPLVEGSLKLAPHYQAIHDKNKELRPKDMQRGFKLSDEQLLWRRDQIRRFRGDMRQWSQEYPATPAEAFQSASRKLVDSVVMDNLDLNSKKEILDRGDYQAVRGSRGKAKRKWVDSQMGRVHRWEKPMPGTMYMVSADTSSGTANDFSAAHVWRVEREMIHLAASFRGRVRPNELAAILSRMGAHYRTWGEYSQIHEGRLNPKKGLVSKIVVERNNHGEWVIYELYHNLGYKRLYKHDERGKADRWRQQPKFGFPTSWQSKMPMLLNMTQLIHDERVIIPCEQTRMEIRGLTYLDDPLTSSTKVAKVGAVQGAFDDMAMSAGVGLWAASRQGRFRGATLSKSSGKPADTMFGITGR